MRRKYDQLTLEERHALFRLLARADSRSRQKYRARPPAPRT